MGSLPRPAALIEALAGTRHDAPPLDPLCQAVIRDTVERFEATGSPGATDGQQRKHHSCWTHLIQGLPNTVSDGLRPFPVADDRRIQRNASQRLGV